MKDAPLNCAEFEVAFYSKCEGFYACGCTGPNSAVLSLPSLAVSPAISAIDINALLIIALLPIINQMTQDPGTFGHSFPTLTCCHK